MSEIETFFRFCPQCGRRFHIKLVSKKLTDVHKTTYEEKRISRPQGYAMSRYSSWAPIIVQETVPVTIDIKDFTYIYKCKHCGHEWAENRVERHREG